MKAITATIQKEQNLIIRHEDVPALLVARHRGQRQDQRAAAAHRIPVLPQPRHRSTRVRCSSISPNPVFAKYIENVLPDLGERNPETITYHDLVRAPASRRPQPAGQRKARLSCCGRIDTGRRGPSLRAWQIFRDIKFYGVRLVSAGAIMQLMQKYPNVPAGPHLVTLVREELFNRLDARLKQMAATEAVQDELLCLSP